MNNMSIWRKAYVRQQGLRNNLAQTPRDLYDKLNKVLQFDFDPCPVDPTFDGLSIEWGKSNFVNPPYAQLGKWIQKAFSEASTGKRCVMLIPVRTHRVYWHHYILPHARVYYLLGTLRFAPYRQNAPFPLCIAIFDFSDSFPDHEFDSQFCQETVSDGTGQCAPRGWLRSECSSQGTHCAP